MKTTFEQADVDAIADAVFAKLKPMLATQSPKAADAPAKPAKAADTPAKPAKAADTPPKPAKATKSAGPDSNDVHAALVAYGKANGGNAAARAIMEKYAPTLTALKPEQYQPLIDELSGKTSDSDSDDFE